MSEVETSTPATTKNPYLMPGAIILAGCIIAGAIVLRSGQAPQDVAGGGTLEPEILPISESDHVLGSRTADVFLVEYSDYRCGYCGLFHETVKQVLTEYEGKVAWVYRHTPYQPGGKEAAIAAECIAELAGEDAFWQYTTKALQNQKLLGAEWHLATAKELGADEAAFNECIASGRHEDTIAQHTMNSQELGGQGTPFNVLLTRKGDIIKFSGAQPLDNVKIFVNRALRSLEEPEA